MARASVDVQTDINNTQKNISDLDDQINSCNAEIQNLETRIAELENEKNIMNDSCQVITDLQNSLISDIENLEPSSVCIQEIRSTSTVSSEINSKCASALKTAEIVVLKIDMQIKNAKKEYEMLMKELKIKENITEELKETEIEFNGRTRILCEEFKVVYKAIDVN